MKSKDTILIIIIAAVVGFGVGYLIYNQSKEEPKVVNELGSGSEGVASQTAVSDNLKVVSQQSPVTFPAIIDEGRSLSKNELPAAIREILPAVQNIPVSEVTFDQEQRGFMISYVANEGLYDSHNTVLGRVRSSSIEWTEIYVARGALGAVVDLSSNDYQVRIIQEAVGESTTRVTLLVATL